MKRLRWLLLALLGLCIVPSARAQIGSRSFTTTVVANDVGVGNIGSGIAYHQISWNPLGTVTTCDARLQGSADNVTYSDIISNQVCTSAGASAVVNTSVNYIKIEVTTLSGGGSVTVHWNGWNASPGGGGSIASCTTTGGVAFENGTANTLTCGNVLTFISGTFTDSASAASTQTSHFGDPDSSIPNVTAFTAEYPGRNEITAVGGPVDTLDTLIVTGYNGPNHAITAINYLNTTIAALPTGITTEVILDGTPGSSTNDVYGHSDFSSMINGASITGDGVESGIFASFRAFPTLNNFTSARAAGSNSHADFMYGFLASPTLGTGAAGDGSTVTNLESFISAPVSFGAGLATNVYGFHATNLSLGGGGSATNQYGFAAEALSGATGSNFGFFDALTNKERFGLLSAVKYSTQTACAGVGTAASPSIASCTAAAAGLFSCATNASTATCQVNTTAVTASSVIQIISSAADGTPLGVTCNTTNTLPTTKPLLASKSAGVSFTINLGTVTANPACFEYVIFN